MTPDDELKSAWKAQPLPRQITMNAEVFLQQLRGNQARFTAEILWSTVFMIFGWVVMAFGIIITLFVTALLDCVLPILQKTAQFKGAGTARSYADLGLDYAISRSIGVGVQIRYHTFSDDPFSAHYLTTFGRVEYTFGW